MENLTNYRQKIDEIDSQMVELFVSRMEVAEKIARYKKENSIPVLDVGRERELLAKVGEQAGETFANYTDALYRTIMSASRSYQNLKLGKPSKVYTTVQSALETTPNLFPQRATVACQGIEGSYSQIASDKLFKTPTIFYFNTFEQVFQAVETGMCRYGVLPIENSSAGSVNTIYDQMISHNFSIVRATRQKIAHVLDTDNNYTRFICISKKPEIYPGADRSSLMMTLSHKPGALHHVLSKFYTHGVNLLKIESRPVTDCEFELMFYFDIECSIYAPEMEGLFRDLEAESADFCYLGSYQEVIC